MLRWLKRLFRRKEPEFRMVCIHKDDAFCWPDHLDERTEGKCTRCGGPIYFEKKNASFVKVCSRCVPLW